MAEHATDLVRSVRYDGQAIVLIYDRWHVYIRQVPTQLPTAICFPTQITSATAAIASYGLS
ncbi:hypothetical protein TcasGA2_TC032090 [Tribolium castaneum]|uniref:Uncharacterized protein n=1 Tax=Tribolium castaneum TaxID=7070 RepID=A0A139WMD8_TRICA|nr:hypothetical protein TcasGA2_TC032090 [Tribolium castaneum]